MTFANAKKRATRAPAATPRPPTTLGLTTPTTLMPSVPSPKLMPNAADDANRAKRDAVRILWKAREQCTPGSTAGKMLTNAMSHIIAPEPWS